MLQANIECIASSSTETPEVQGKYCCTASAKACQSAHPWCVAAQAMPAALPSAHHRGASCITCTPITVCHEHPHMQHVVRLKGGDFLRRR